MNATVLGCSPSFPNPGGACSGYLLQTETVTVLVDAGHGVCARLRAVTDVCELSAVIISHLHADHFFDLIPLLYTHRFTCPGMPPIPLFLPPGGAATIDRLNSALKEPPEFFSQAYAVSEYEPRTGMAVGDISVEFTATVHPGGAYAMRFTEQRRPEHTIVYSSDTAWSEAVVDLARNASLAIVEASVLDYHEEGTDRVHLTPELAGRLGREAGVKRLVLTHYADFNAAATREAAEQAFGKPVELAVEGATYRV